MAKLTAALRARAQNELRAGSKLSEVAVKFGITPSAASYLKAQATGITPEVAALETEFSKYQLERLKRLVTAGTSYKEIAEDYEVSKPTIVAYCNKLGITVGGGVKPTKKIKITPRGNGKRK
jgi:hypothetical protein